MLKVGICDDEPTVCTKIKDIIFKYSKLNSKKIEVDVFNSGEELYEYLLNDYCLDIIFLDIELDELDGIEVGKKIREEFKNELTQIIYISSKKNYAMELFDVRPLNFLIKPVEDTKVFEVLDKAMELLDRIDGYFEYKTGHNFCKTEIKDILYFESDNRKVKMVTKNSEIVFYDKLSDIHLSLESHRFFFSHKSYLVNFYHVSRFYYDKLLMTNSHVLPISQSKRPSVRKLQLRYERGDI
jgi:DNA-binding LytR/AlgR family response regulator